MSKKIAVVTGSRAEYGLLKPVLKKIKEDSELELKLYATGMHIEGRFGRTVEEIKADGFEVAKMVDIFLQDDTARGVARSTALSMMGFADVFASDRPDALLVLGDRFEIYGAVSAACVHGIPVAHIHGGELTEGVMDDSFRHCITKMAHLHFTVAEQYRRRVVQLGEQPGRVFNTGSPSVDAAMQTELMSREELEADLGVTFGRENLLVTFHPVVLADMTPAQQFTELLAALEKTDAYIILTYANADTGGAEINRMIEEFASENASRCLAVPSLGHRRYISVMKMCSGLVGNSSSGLIEASVFAKGAVNIGIRQQGRVRGVNVIDCGNGRDEIYEAILMLESEGFKRMLGEMPSPYGDGDAAGRIVDILKKTDLNNLKIKRFYDLEI